MNAFTILEAMDAIDDRTLGGALSFAQKAVKTPKKRKAKWLPWVAAAACLCLIVAGAVGIIRKSLPAPSDFVIQEGVLIGYTGSDTSVVIPEGVLTIADGAFRDNTTLQSVSAPSVTSVGNGAFENCPALQSASFPDATRIGEYAFRGCSALTELGIGCATSVGIGFIDGTSIKVLMIPEVVEGLGELTFTDPKPELWGYRNSPLQAFAEQYGFTFVDIDEKTQAFGDFTYLEFPDHIRVCEYTGNQSDIVIPEQINAKPVTELRYELTDNYALTYERVSINEITSLIAPSVQRLIVEPWNEEWLNLYCFHSLTVLDMPMLRSLPDQAFYECVSLSEIHLDSLQSIGSNVFCCGQFTDLYLPEATSIAPDAFAQTEIRTLHGYKDSYTAAWAAQNGYGFVDMQNDYIPEYAPREIDASALVYHSVAQSTSKNTPHGQVGVDIAHDRAGTLYLHVRDWDAYFKTTLKQYADYSRDAIDMERHTAAVCGDTVWLIAGTQPLYTFSQGMSSFSMLSLTRNGKMQTFTAELGQTVHPRKLSLYFSDTQNGKLLVVHEEQLDYQLLLFETHDGGRTWSRVQSDTLPVSHGGAKQARPFAAIGFVSDLIGFASIEYRAEIEPETRTYLTFDGGKTWEKWNYQTTKDEMPEGYGDTVALSQKDGVLYLTVSVQGGNLENPYYLAYKSTDNGASWQPCQ